MDTYSIIAQGFGILGMIMGFISFQCKKLRNYYIFYGLLSVGFTINFLMLGAYTACLSNIVAISRSIFLAKGGVFTKKPFMWGLIVLGIIIGAFTWDGIYTVMLVVAISATTYTQYTGKENVIKPAQLFCISPLWLIHNICKFSIGGIICEIFNMISVVIYYARTRKLKIAK